jgi:indole-3-glycerol phosphate synthase
MIPADRIVVTESGVQAPEDVARMRAHGVRAFLIGETFMKSTEPGQALEALFRAWLDVGQDNRESRL